MQDLTPEVGDPVLGQTDLAGQVQYLIQSRGVDPDGRLLLQALLWPDVATGAAGCGQILA